LEWIDAGLEHAGGTGTPGTIGTSPAPSSDLEEVQVSLETSQGSTAATKGAMPPQRTVLTDPMLEKLRKRRLAESQTLPAENPADNGPRVAERPEPTLNEGDARRWLEEQRAGTAHTPEVADVQGGHAVNDEVIL
jgi:hypothetical protein